MIFEFNDDERKRRQARLEFLNELEVNTLKEIATIQGLQQGRQQGLQEGLQQGIAEGEMKEKLAIAKNLKLNNISIDIIASSTGLSKEEIEKL